MGFQQGLSGLNASSTALDVIGNNISNSSTVGFKAANAHFADVYATMMSGVGGSQVGIGTSVMGIQQEFAQGNVSSTKNPLDIAINGDGFFRMSTDGAITYSRNGQFHADKNGYIVDDKMRKLTGYPSNPEGKVIVSAPTELKIDAGDLSPRKTGPIDKGMGVVDLSTYSASLGLDGSVAIHGGGAYPTAPAMPTVADYEHSWGRSVRDSTGKDHYLQVFAVKTAMGAVAAPPAAAVPETWTLHFALDGQGLTQTQDLSFDKATGTQGTVPAVLTLPTVNTGGTAGEVKVDFNNTHLGAVYSGGVASLATAETGIEAGVRANFNLDSRSAARSWQYADNSVASRTKSPDPTDYNWSTSTAVYDSLGNAHTLTFFAVKTENPREWEMHFTVDGTRDSNVTTTNPILRFDSNGKLEESCRFMGVSINLDKVMSDLSTPENPLINSASTPLEFNIDFKGTSEYGHPFGVNSLEQDGYTAGRLIGVSVSKDGVVSGNYTNGKTREMGQVVLARFTDPNGLLSLGGNQWAETYTSGAPLVGAPNSSRLGTLQSSSVEESNTDLTVELVKMIVQQRNYQANAQTIKTQDQILQTLVNLR